MIKFLITSHYNFYVIFLQNLSDNRINSNSEEKLESVDEIDYLCSKLQSCSLHSADDQDKNSIGKCRKFVSCIKICSG